MNILLTGITGVIGKSIFKSLITKEHNIFGFYKGNEAAALELKELSRYAKGNLFLFKGDSSDIYFLESSVKEIISINGDIDLVIHNAGKNKDNFFLNMTMKEWHSVINTNLIANILLTQTILNYQSKQNFRILNVISVSAIYGREAQTNYSASKGGVVGYSKLLSTRKGSDIQIVNIAPGMIASSMVDGVPKKSLENFLDYTSKRCLGSADDIAEFVDYFAHMTSRYMTNMTIKIDGGFMR